VTLGPPIYLKVDAGQTLTLSNFSITTGVSNVAATVLTSTNDPQITSNEIFVVPNAALLPNTNYQVFLNGSISGTPFTRSFTMTTGL
jgi:hypothetical protein